MGTIADFFNDGAALETTSAGKFEPIADGDYLVYCKEARREPTKDGKGERVIPVFVVDDGPRKGAYLRDWITIEHPDTKTLQRGARAFTDLCSALRVDRNEALKDQSLLTGRRCTVTTRLVESNNPKYPEPSAFIRGYTLPTRSAATPAPANSGDDSLSW